MSGLGLFERRRQNRLWRRLERERRGLRDAESYLSKWRFSMPPSEIERRERAIARDEASIAVLEQRLELTPLDPPDTMNRSRW